MIIIFPLFKFISLKQNKLSNNTQTLLIQDIRTYNSNHENYYDDTMSCKKYSEILKDQGATEEEIKEAQGHEYFVCESTFLNNVIRDKANDYNLTASFEGRNKIKSFLNSEYCDGLRCAIIGAVGPAWK